MVLTPALEADVERRVVPGGLLLRHRRFGTQLVVSGEERLAVEAMDGTRTLEALEEVLIPQEGTLGYQSMVMLLYRLWDRGLLADGESFKAALFPHQTDRTVDKALSGRWVRRLGSLPLLGSGVARALSFLAPLGRIFSSDAFLALTGSLLVVALVYEFADLLHWPEHLFFLNGSWVTGILVLYLGLAGSMSLRGVVRAAILAGPGGGLDRAGIRVMFGIVHFDVDDTVAYHLDRDLQIRFALAGLFVLGGLSGVLLQIAVFAQEPWRHIGAAALLAAFANTCPFLQTDGARLIELLGGAERQRFRVRSFIVKRLLKGGHEGRGSETVRLTLVATAWIIWFFAAARIFTFLILNDLISLEAAVTSGHHPTLTVVGGLFLAALFLGVFAIVGTLVFMIFAFIIQLVTPQRVDKPKERATAEMLGDPETISAQLKELPITRVLPDSALTELVNRVQVLRYQAGACLHRAGGVDHRILWVLEGEVELRSPRAEGGHTLVAVMGEGNHFGDESLASEPCRYDAVARGDVRLMGLDSDALRELSSVAAEDTEGMQRAFELARFLDVVPEMAGLSPSARLELAFHVVEKDFPAGAAVVREGDPSPTMYLIRSGRCIVTKRATDGTDQYLADIGELGTFGEVGLLYDQPRMATVTCSEPSALVEVPCEALDAAMKQSFHVGLALERLAVDRVEGGQA